MKLRNAWASFSRDPQGLKSYLDSIRVWVTASMNAGSVDEDETKKSSAELKKERTDLFRSLQRKGLTVGAQRTCGLHVIPIRSDGPDVMLGIDSEGQVKAYFQGLITCKTNTCPCCGREKKISLAMLLQGLFKHHFKGLTSSPSGPGLFFETFGPKRSGDFDTKVMVDLVYAAIGVLNRWTAEDGLYGPISSASTVDFVTNIGRNYAPGPHVHSVLALDHWPEGTRGLSEGESDVPSNRLKRIYKKDKLMPKGDLERDLTEIETFVLMRYWMVHDAFQVAGRELLSKSVTRRYRELRDAGDVVGAKKLWIAWNQRGNDATKKNRPDWVWDEAREQLRTSSGRIATRMEIENNPGYYGVEWRCKPGVTDDMLNIAIDAYDLRTVPRLEGLGTYLAKFALEVSGGGSKTKSKAGARSVTPLQLARLAVEGDERAAEAYMGYLEAFKGKPLVIFGGPWKALHKNIEPEPLSSFVPDEYAHRIDDEDGHDDVAATVHVATVPSWLWRELRKDEFPSRYGPGGLPQWGGTWLLRKLEDQFSLVTAWLGWARYMSWVTGDLVQIAYLKFIVGIHAGSLPPGRGYGWCVLSK